MPASLVPPPRAPASRAPASRFPAARRAAWPALLALPLLAACLPASGPTATAIRAGAAESRFAVVALDAPLAERLAALQAADLAGRLGAPGGRLEGGADAAIGGGGAADIRIGVGDTLAVSIYEAASGGLFSGEPGAAGGAAKSVSLPPQPVARNGTISVPYVGQVKAAGRTPAEVQAAIEAGLKDKAIEPQVLVTVGSGASTFVTVAGDVASPGRVPLNLGGDRILDVIAGAGGSKGPAYDSFVRLTRGGRTATISLAALVDDPAQNLYLRPDDQIFVVTDPQIYTAFGATARNAAFPFETDRLTLAEAVGRAGGLLDSRANARGVFVFRNEDPDAVALLRQHGALADANPATDPAADPIPTTADGAVPVIYQLDLKNPESLFAAQTFLMQDNDVLYVSNAPATDLQKVFGIVSGGVRPAASATGLGVALTN